MAVPIEEFTIIEVRKPNVGENKPADVTADIVIETSRKHQKYTLPVCTHILMFDAHHHFLLTMRLLGQNIVGCNRYTQSEQSC